MCVQTCTFAYAHVSTHMSTHISLTRVHIHVYTHVCTNVYAHVCAYVCRHTSLHAGPCTCIHTSLYQCLHISVCTHAHTHACTHARPPLCLAVPALAMACSPALPRVLVRRYTTNDTYRVMAYIVLAYKIVPAHSSGPPSNKFRSELTVPFIESEAVPFHGSVPAGISELR